VWLDGGPSHPGAASLPPGSYYVKVTEPDGTVLGSSVPNTPYVVQLVNGVSVVPCLELDTIVKTASSLFQSPGFDDTTNPGGEYKVWVSTDSSFANDSTKTDNFKVFGSNEPPPTTSITGVKFYDTNVNGVQDSGEPGINGWHVKLFTQDPSTLLYSFTSDDQTHTVPPTTGIDGTYEFDNLSTSSVYGVCEVIPSGSPTWVPTTQQSYKNVGAPSFGLNFGNVCLGNSGQSPVTLGFWSNKNGQFILTGSKTGTSLVSPYTGVNSLHLKNATGGSAVPFANYAALQTFLLKATATNMAYMLSAQLATMDLNVLSGNVSGAAIIYAPGTGLSHNGIPDFTTVQELINAADADLALSGHNLTLSGSPYRAHQEALKNALDGGNNDNNFVQPSLSACTVSYAGGDTCAP
jgi:hypothetical protein